MSKPVVVDLFCGLGGFSKGFIAEGYHAIGFDIERHDYGTGGYPGELVLQDVHTLHGRQFKNAACIVASPPCQEFSYMAMPWKRAKQIAAALRGEYSDDGLSIPFPEDYKGSRTIAQLTALFDACFRLQREASEAAGRHIPMVVENVKGAQPWVGRANANYGSFYLWGDVRSVGGRIVPAHRVEFGAPGVKALRAQKFNPDGTQHGTGSWFAVADSKNRGSRSDVKGHGGTWFGIQNNGDRYDQREVNPCRGHALKVPGLNFHDFEKTGKPGRSFQSAAVELAGVKSAAPHAWFNDHKKAGVEIADDDRLSRTGSKSAARKAASAMIAEIPLELSTWVARCFRPERYEDALPAMSTSVEHFVKSAPCGTIHPQMRACER